jgi:hypothetical protein
LAFWLQTQTGFTLRTTEKDLLQSRFSKNTHRITFAEFLDQVVPQLKDDREVDEEEDPDAQQVEEHYENLENADPGEEMGADSEVDSQVLRNRYIAEANEERRPEFIGGSQQESERLEDEVPEPDESETHKYLEGLKMDDEEEEQEDEV